MSNPAASPIADLSYRNYDGPLENPRMRWWVVAKATMRQATKKKMAWGMAITSAWYYLAMIFTVFIVEQIAASTARPEISKTFMSRIVWKDQFLHGFSFGQLMLLLIALFIGAGGIANDNRANALLVYLSKPMTKFDYVLGKWVGLFVPLFAVSAVPATVFYLYGALSFRSYGFLTEEPWLFPKMLIALLLVCSFHASMLTGVSSLFNQGRMAGATYAGIYFFSNFFTQMMVVPWINLSMNDNNSPFKGIVHNLYYLSIDGMNVGLFKTILGTDGTPYFGIPQRTPMVPKPDWWVLGLMFALGLSALLIAWRRVRAVEVVG